jgi:hypothetical protein
MEGREITGKEWKVGNSKSIWAWFEVYCTMTINKTDGTEKVLLERWMWKISDVQSSHYGPFKSNNVSRTVKRASNKHQVEWSAYFIIN